MRPAGSRDGRRSRGRLPRCQAAASGRSCGTCGRSTQSKASGLSASRMSGLQKMPGCRHLFLDLGVGVSGLVEGQDVGVVATHCDVRDRC